MAVPLIAMLTLRANPQFGFEGLFFLFAIVWLTDIGAYIAGRTVGGPRLAPAISPGKTWAGALGGLLLAVAGGYWGAGFMANPPPLGAIALAICLSLATQCGDLFESWVKRRFGKKDSGTIVPGHGGILDRIDGLLFAAPVMAAITFA
jgi:phosphatidate cytidylyltransferase